MIFNYVLHGSGQVITNYLGLKFIHYLNKISIFNLSLIMNCFLLKLNISFDTNVWSEVWITNLFIKSLELKIASSKTLFPVIGIYFQPLLMSCFPY